MKFIEMFGLPGVGKSTLTNELAKIAAEGGGSVLGFDSSIVLSQQVKYGVENLGSIDFDLMFSHKRWFFYVLALYLGASCSRRMALKRIGWTFDVLKVFSQCDRLGSGRGVLLRDEGFCCRGFSLALSMERWVFLREYFLRMPAPDCVVFLSASVACIRERVERRALKNGGVVSNPVGSYEYYLDFLMMVEEVLRERKIKIVKINAEDDLRLQVLSLELFVRRDLLDSSFGLT